MNKILRYALIGIVFLVPFVALIVDTSLFFPYITGKNFAFRILIELGFGIWLILALRAPEYRLRWSAILTSIAVFVGVMAIADAFGIYPYKSFFSNYERMEGWITLIHLLGFFIIAASILNTKKLWYWFLHTSLLVSIIMGIFGIVELAGGTPRIDGTLGNSTYLGIFMLFNIFIALFYLFRHFEENIYSRGVSITVSILYGVLIIYDGFILYYTQTRGSVVGLFGGIFLMAILFAILGKNYPKLRKSGIGFIVLVILLIIFGAAVRNTNFAKNHSIIARFSALDTLNFKQTLDTEGEGRLLIWSSAIKGIEERPILGWGQENFNYVFAKYFNPGAYSQEEWFDRTHDVFLDWAIDGGIIGLLAYLSIFGATLYCIWRKKNNTFSLGDKSILSGMLLAYFIHNLFVFDNISSYIIFFFILAYVNFSNTEAFIPSEKKIINADIINYALIPIIVIVTLYGIYAINYPAYAANLDLISALSPHSAEEGGYNANLDYYTKALGYNTFGNPEIREQLLQTTAQIIQSNDADTATKQAFLNLSTTEIPKQIALTPQDVRYYYLYGLFLNSIGEPKEALPYIQKAQQLAPEKQTVLYQLGSIDIETGDITQGVAVFKQAYEEDTTDDQAKLLYAIALIYSGDNTDADAFISQLQNTEYITDPRLFSAYYQTKQFNKVFAIINAQIAKNPNDPQNHLDLATAYLQEGDKTDAVNEINKVEVLYPAFKSQGDAYIEEIKSGTSTESSQ